MKKKLKLRNAFVIATKSKKGGVMKSKKDKRIKKWIYIKEDW